MSELSIKEIEKINCAICSKKQSKLFCDMRSGDLKQMAEQRSFMSYEKGDLLYEEGTISKWLYCIHTGKVKLHRVGLNGKTRITRVVGKGDIIGQFDSIGESKHSSSATAIEKSIVCLIPKKYLTNELGNKYLHLPLIKVLSADINEVEKNMVSFSNGTAKNLIIKCLLSLHEKFGLKEDKKTLDIYLTRKEYGEILGISTETVIRVFSQLQNDGFIVISGKEILIKNLKGMQMEVI